MKRLLFSTLIALAASHDANAGTAGVCNGNFQPVVPFQHDGVAVSSWRDNWFFAISGGPAAFIGSPIGCEDLFGRVKPALQLSLGKWHTPSVGTRLVFQGFKWKSGSLTDQRYRHWHADFLWNLIPALAPERKDCRWDVIPYIGLGLIDNRDADTRPFAVSYGLQGRYRMSDRLHATMEIGNAMTFKNADGRGSAIQMGDHLLTVSAGIAWTFGKHRGWKKVIDTGPYMVRSEQPTAYVPTQKKESQPDCTARSGWKRDFPVNDYSGLNSLRRRIREGKTMSGQKPQDKDGSTFAAVDSIVAADTTSCRTVLGSGNHCTGVPVYFFFELGTSSLSNKSQLVNLDEIARIAKKFNLLIDVTGAADSATGTEMINSNLGTQRASFIAEYLIDKGVSADHIKTTSAGGIDDYSPDEANRNAIVRLFLP